MTLARDLRDAIEPFHSMCYFAPELRSPYVDVHGMHPWASYFAQRACPMGAVSAGVVTATFYGFNPRLVERSIPIVWSKVTPEEAWTARIAGVDAALDRLLADQASGDAVGEAVPLAATALSALQPAGRPLGAAHAAMPVPDRPILALWHHVAAIREYRGDGHVAALVAHSVDPIESLVTAGSYSNLSSSFHRRNRGWSDDEWDAAIGRCRDKGWIDADGAPTAAGDDLRRSVEEATDATMASAIAALGDAGVARLGELVGSLSNAVVAAGGFR